MCGVMCTCRFDCANKASISEKDGCNWNAKMTAEHVNDIGFIAEFWVQGIIIRSTGNLHSLWDVSVLKQ